ncbi:MAG: hypothetical protein IT447_16595 [Phycisphaerales bacterium]|jgi:xylulokinase|nr:hypothetical protein [Phycisphaerales bacterium]
MGHILTFDLGTTYFKAALFDEVGRLVALTRVPTPLEVPREGWCEMSAGGFVDAIRSAADQLRQQAPREYADVVAIGFATQANSFVLLDSADRPLMPFIIWTDRRGKDVEPDLQPLQSQLRQTTGVPSLTGEFSIAKLMWLAKHRPDVWKNARRFCYLSDYLTFYLTGRHVTEAGMASLSGMMDVHRLQWWPAAMDLVRPDKIAFPQIVRAGTEVGTILGERAAELGLPTGCRMVIGCLDQYAGGIGAKNIQPGMISETTGTALATVRCSDRFEPDLPMTAYQGPAFEAGYFYQMTFGSTSANLLEALRNHAAKGMDYPDLTAAAERVPPGADGLRLKNDAYLLPVDQMFANLRAEHTLGHKVRAVLEGVAFSLQSLIGQLTNDAVAGPIHSCGGAARSRFWLQIKADVINVPFQAMTCPEPTSQGAALLAGRALGWGSLAELSARWSTTQSPVEPDAKQHQTYQAIHMSGCAGQ